MNIPSLKFKITHSKQNRKFAVNSIHCIIAVNSPGDYTMHYLVVLNEATNVSRKYLHYGLRISK